MATARAQADAELKWNTSLEELVLYSALYLVMVLVLVVIMERLPKETKFELRRVKTVYNFFMCIFSAWMFWGSMDVLLANWKDNNYDLRLMMCDDTMALRPGFGFWFYVFFLSKFIEFLDTVFLIANRKYGRTVSFALQVYHHAITASVAWVAWFYPVPAFWVGLVTNTFVHIFMYLYFALATSWPGLRAYGRYITQLQLAQFFFCVTLGGAVVPTYMYLNNCEGSWGAWLYIESVYASFLVFFLLFASDKKKRTKKQD